jgi:hypothetical protein
VLTEELLSFFLDDLDMDVSVSVGDEELSSPQAINNAAKVARAKKFFI